MSRKVAKKSSWPPERGEEEGVWAVLTYSSDEEWKKDVFVMYDDLMCF